LSGADTLPTDLRLIIEALQAQPTFAEADLFDALRGADITEIAITAGILTGALPPTEQAAVIRHYESAVAVHEGGKALQ